MRQKILHPQPRRLEHASASASSDDMDRLIFSLALTCRDGIAKFACPDVIVFAVIASLGPRDLMEQLAPRHQR
jgi:hypothetical protein